MGLSGGADVASVQQQPVVGIGDIRFRDMLYEFLFYFIWRICALADESKSVGYTIHMGVNSQRRFAERAFISEGTSPS